MMQINQEPTVDPPALSQPRRRAIAVLALGAVCGTLARDALSRIWPVVAGTFPLTTLAINLTGAFVLGFLLEALVRSGDDRGRRELMRLFLGTGFCGTFTTYSTFAVEAELLARAHHLALALTYVLISVIGGLGSTYAGIAAAARVHSRHGVGLR